jgi:hypothetical protein
MPQRLRSGTQRRVGLAACLAGVVVGALTSAPSVHADGGHPVSAVCPASLTGTATCYTGQDSNGAYYAIAIPKTWNGSFVVHAHGGPDLGDGSDPERSVGDLDRWAVMVKEGYAWAGSSYRRGGYGTRMAAEDTENVRRLFIKEFGTPKRTYVHGQSWGGDVAAKVVETYSSKHGPYDGALLTSGVLAGGSRGYDYRVDLRVVYQYYCHNHPRPTEPQYPLWEGLRAGSTMTTTGLRARLQPVLARNPRASALGGIASSWSRRAAPRYRCWVSGRGAAGCLRRSRGCCRTVPSSPDRVSKGERTAGGRTCVYVE